MHNIVDGKEMWEVAAELCNTCYYNLTGYFWTQSSDGAMWVIGAIAPKHKSIHITEGLH